MAQGSPPPPSNKVFRKLRSEAKSGLDLATRILMMEETRAVVQGACMLARPVAEEHAMTAAILKTKSGTLEWSIEMAFGERVGHLGDIFKQLLDPGLLVTTGLFSCKCDDSADFDDDVIKRILESYVTYSRELLFGEIMLLRSYSDDLPLALAMMMSSDDVKRARGADCLRIIFARVTECEKVALNDSWLRQFILNVRTRAWSRCGRRGDAGACLRFSFSQFSPRHRF
ncbi:unnamed protein product [Prorocentrum cordatum]|uniref:HEAT repeat-containing protein 1 n=1 Tax=Prorocentrum cordatum TaxID=2364126 RepID=A0ABN9Q8H1_9DINO|nr:unnamed protein product [Polarella glacialis]